MLRVDCDGFPADLNETWCKEKTRFRETLRRIPQAATPDARILDLGSTRAWLPFHQVLLGYRHIVLNTSYPEARFVDASAIVRDAAPAHVEVSVFDVERDDFPIDDASCDVVLCLELLEHLAIDPMAMMSEINRVLKPGGTLVLSTPNAVRYDSLVRVALGEQPYGWNPYNGFDTNRHNREYTPSEIERLFSAGGFTPSEVTTVGRKSRGAMRVLLAAAFRVAIAPIRRCPSRWRNDIIIAVGMKVASCVDRRPAWLYFDMAERKNLLSLANVSASSECDDPIEIEQTCHAERREASHAKRFFVTGRRDSE
ncbi:MAG: class I SAM-dependent methyltransferase [Planctomycetes bacterium]|nr:class I SAM-dependent methyltransferase [Planctomycetota bacterium]